MATLLTMPVTREDIKQALCSMPSSKTPGPDGNTKEFFVAAWTIVGADVVTAVQSFFNNGFMPRGVNSMILTSFPNELWKISDRLLVATQSTRLSRRFSLLGWKLFSPKLCSQIKAPSSFVKCFVGYRTCQGLSQRQHLTRCALKLDITKAFDTVRWDFIIQTLRDMRIPELFIFWIRKCISTASFSVCINGELEGFFTSTRGLRQGCSLSPILFVMVINVLSHRLNKAATENKFGFHPWGKKVNLTHLRFADEIIIFTDGQGDSITGIANVLKEFEWESGLAINMMKSALFMAGKTNHELQEKASMLGLPIEQLPIRYLGLPLTTKSMMKTDYEPIVDRIRNSLIMWSSKTLSYAGRLQLINSVIASIANFWSSAFRLPKRCFETIEKMCNAFLWSGSPHTSSKAKVAWEDLCVPKREGGLGIQRMQDMSKALA